MTYLGDWLRDLGEAAEELGYGIENMDAGPARVVLVRVSPDATKVTIETVLLSGSLLRQLLRPAPPIRMPKDPLAEQPR